MERFNTTTKGYRFDKVIFWIAYLMVISIVAKIIIENGGVAANPYINCTTESGCLNPFSTESGYWCKFGFMLFDCPVKDYDWMKEENLPKGEYGLPPKDFGWFFPSVLALFGIAFILNHMIWNKGQKFHINILDKI